MSLAGIVLCGGRSSRMGTDKAWLPYGAESQLAAVCRALAAACHPILVVAAAEQAVPPLPAAALIVRDREPHLGPLHGLAVGLDALPADCPGAFVSSCDVPELSPALVALACRRLAPGCDIALPFAGGRGQPLSAAYRRNVATTAWALLAAGRRRPMFLLDAHPHVLLPEVELRRADPALASFRHANTPAEFAALAAPRRDDGDGARAS